MTKAYKLRRAKQSDTVTSYNLAVPPEIGQAISDDTRFVCELNEEGILYRPVLPGEVEKVEVPSWATGAIYDPAEPEEVGGNRKRS